jgi:hypothetical protein
MRTEPIDLVYTLVDDSFPGFQEERARYATTAHDSDRRRTRDNLDLLKYSLRSIERFAPWLRNIYIVTCSPQAPQWLKADHPRIRMIYHEEIMPPELLPSFNAFAIESFLHKIPGLSKRFVHFNDDMLLLRPAGRDLFETEDGRPIFYFHGLLPSSSKPINESNFPHTSGRKNCARALDRVFGRRQHWEQAHHPRIVDCDGMEEIIGVWPEEFDRTRAARFRQHDTILPHKFLASYMTENHTAEAVGPSTTARLMYIVFLCNSVVRNRWRIFRAKQRNPVFLCLNDAFGAYVHPPTEEAAKKLLEQTFPDASSFET